MRWLLALAVIAIAVPAHAHQSAVKAVDLQVDGRHVDIAIPLAPGDVAEPLQLPADAHDTESKLKVAVAQHELASQGGAAIARAQLDAIEREKLDLYQRRYAEYIKVAKALQALIKS